MLKTIRDAVKNPIQFEKVAEFELSKNVSDWNDEIIQKFYEDVSYIPKEFNTEIVVKSVDENNGYAKGSIVVWYNGKKVNFPIIVKEYKLSPFDIFVKQEKGSPVYMPANLNNLKKALSTEILGELENKYKQAGRPDIKSVGGADPKQAVNLDSVDYDMQYPPFSKMSSWWLKKAKLEDLEKFSQYLESEPDVMESFVDNTGDLVANIIEMKDNKGVAIADDHKSGILDLKNVVKAKRAVTSIDYDFFDVNSLQPIHPPSVCEIRLYQYPSMEDFIESGEDIRERMMVSSSGKPIAGVILDLKNPPSSSYPESLPPDDKLTKDPRPQVFISLDGKYYSTHEDYGRTGVCFYGSNILPVKNSIERAVDLVGRNTSDMFTNLNYENRNDGSDKLFKAMELSDQGQGGSRDRYNTYCNTDLIIVYGAGNSYEAMWFKYSNFKRKTVNGIRIYVSDEYAIIPANVPSPQGVASVKDPVYKMSIGSANKIILIPEGSVVINTSMMNKLNTDDIMRPSRPVREIYEKSDLDKVSFWLTADGYRISGKPYEPLEKISRMEGLPLNTKQAETAFNIMGIENGKFKEMAKVAFQRYYNRTCQNKTVSIYGLNDDYINPDAYKGIEKQAKVKSIMSDIATKVKKNLIKEASALNDPESVDVVLSLNFINEDSLKDYIEHIPEIKRIMVKLSEILVASRMGLSEVDEGAIKGAIEGLSSVVNDLENIKMTVEKYQ